MRKTLLLIVTILGISNCFAQECNLCGTWSGVFKVFLDGDNTTERPFIKIRRYGDKYVVQVKEVYTYNDQSSKTYYWHECTDVNVNDNVISWRSFSHQVDDWDGERHNGKLIAKSKHYKVCTATLDNGILHFSETITGDFFDRYGNKIGEFHQPAYPTKDLFKDDDNW